MLAGGVVGALWGGVEAALLQWTLPAPGGTVLALPGMDLAPPSMDPFTTLAVIALGATGYGVVGLVLGGLVAPLLGKLLAREQAAELGPVRAMVALVVCLNLFWTTKPFFAFTWGLPFHHPKRLAIDVAWALIAALTAVLVVRRPARGVRVRLAVGVLAAGAVWWMVRLSEGEMVGLRQLDMETGLMLAGLCVVAWCGGLAALWPGWLSPPRPALAVGVLLVVGAGGTWGALREGSTARFADRPAPAGRPPNVLFVVVDALRADRLGCYGYDLRVPPVSPNLDAMTADGVVFESTTTQAPFTWTSFGSFLTGKYPRNHGLMKMVPNQKLNLANNRTLARALADEGYVTGAFLTGTLSNESGLLDGFDTYFEAIVGHEPVTRASRWSVVRSDMVLLTIYNKLRQALDRALVNTVAMDWIREHADRPFFALVHYYTTHTPYDPPREYVEEYDPGYDGIYSPFTQSMGYAVKHHGYEFTDRDLQHVEALYDAGVREADDMFGDLLALLSELGILDDTIVIFTSDHGEELYEHGVFEHDWMYDTNLHVPLVVRFPQAANGGTRVTWPVEMIDVPMTVLAAAGLGELLEADGRSLVPDAAGTEPEADQLYTFSENNRYISIQDPDYKLIKNHQRAERVPRYYDRKADPGEFHGDAALPDGVRARLQSRLDQQVASMPSYEDATQMGKVPEDETLRQRLIELGYLAPDGTKVDGVQGPNELDEDELTFPDEATDDEETDDEEADDEEADGGGEQR